jgi:hypothetical protein
VRGSRAPSHAPLSQASPLILITSPCFFYLSFSSAARIAYSECFVWLAPILLQLYKGSVFDPG